MSSGIPDQLMAYIVISKEKMDWQINPENKKHPECNHQIKSVVGALKVRLALSIFSKVIFNLFLSNSLAHMNNIYSAMGSNLHVVSSECTL